MAHEPFESSTVQRVDYFGAAVRAARPSAPSLPFVSNLTGDFITAAEATDPEYWAAGVSVFERERC